RLVRVERVEVDLAEAVQAGPVAELGLEVRAQQLKELRLLDLAPLELEERVVAALLGRGAQRLAEVFGRYLNLVLDPFEAAEQRRRQDAAEVGDDRPDSVGRRLTHRRCGRP